MPLPLLHAGSGDEAGHHPAASTHAGQHPADTMPDPSTPTIKQTPAYHFTLPLSIFPNPLLPISIKNGDFCNFVFPKPTYNELSLNNHNKQHKSRIYAPKKY
jgi:hypothetical protein